jgi:nucleotide-binding universal stress UspA family protein
MFLIGYDGSADSQAAVDHLAGLMPGASVTVLAVWKSFEPSLDYHGGLAGAVTYDGPLGHSSNRFGMEGLDATLEAAARAKAVEGSDRATEAGLVATPRVARQVTSVAEAILETADELDASAIVLGSRGLTGARSWFAGSVSNGAIQHADRPVIVVPSQLVAEKRAAHRRHAEPVAGVLA